MFEIDELKIYRGSDIPITDKIVVTQPTIDQIIEFGEKRYFGVVHCLTGVGADFKWQLWDYYGIDYTTIDDFELFKKIIWQSLSSKKYLYKELTENREKYEEQLKNIEDKLEKTNKEIQNILNAIMSGIVNNMLKDKLDELEQIKTNLEIRLVELKMENSNSDVINITEEQIKSMFSKFREYVLTRNLPECKKFISQYIKEVIIYKDYVEVIFNVVFSFVNDEINHNVYITAKREEIKLLNYN